MYYNEEDFLTEEESQLVDNEILSNNFPWYFQGYSTSNKFPFYSHVIVPRCEEDEINPSNSTLYDFFLPIIDRFREKHSMEKTPILRMCLNASSSDPRDIIYPHTDIHVDHHFSHKAVILYLNDDFEDGNTILFARYYCEGLETNYDLDKYNKEEFPILAQIQPKKNKLICFDGRIFHAAGWTKNNKRRVALITTFK